MGDSTLSVFGIRTSLVFKHLLHVHILNFIQSVQNWTIGTFLFIHITVLNRNWLTMEPNLKTPKSECLDVHCINIIVAEAEHAKDPLRYYEEYDSKIFSMPSNNKRPHRGASSAGILRPTSNTADLVSAV